MHGRSYGRRVVAAATALASALAVTGACAQSDYPRKTIRMIIPFAPGGASDFVGRIVAQRMSDILGQQIIADNRGGAAGNIGMEVAARAPADGYTVYQGNIGTLAINPNLYTSLKVVPTRDFAPIGQQVDVPGALVLHPSLPARSVKELIALARARPGDLNFGSPGAGSANRLEMEFFMRAAGVKMVHVPYKGGAGPAITGLMGGETGLMFVTLSSAVTFVKAGRLRAIGVVAPKRVGALPEVPTMSEQGFPQMTTGSWQGLLVPTGTPREIVDRLYAATMKAMEDPAVRKRLGDGGVEVVTSASPDEFGRFIARETERWARVIKDAGVTAD